MKTRITKYLSILALAFTLSIGTTTPVEAQCPMCRISAESNLKNGGTAGRGLNNGILFMLAMPYLVVGALGFVWWRSKRRDEDEELA
ncbi:MAG: hypothetical protein KDD06_01235 [Phaeodactylibacter sp.]|nr:hypothetical protein [Phaeodactylibacter sp.]MCB9264301.1 hypothetical protein [Lewinellaceae bacterium]MCB9290795.1 hypothetical protein [Lewinellaceae bacterium]